MNELPMWWLILSGIFFAMNTLLFIAMAVMLFKLGQAVQDLKPKVESLVVKVDGVTTKVDALTTTLHETVKNVGEKASGVAGSANVLAQTTSKVFEKYAPLLAIATTAFRIFGAIREYRQAKQVQHMDDEE